MVKGVEEDAVSLKGKYKWKQIKQIIDIDEPRDFYSTVTSAVDFTAEKQKTPGVDKQHQSIWQNKFLLPSFNFFPDSFLFIGQKSVCTVTCSDCRRLAVEPLCGNRLLVYHLTKNHKLFVD